MRIVIAPDKFKGSLTAAEVAQALAEGLSGRSFDVELIPIADGGEGTVEAALTSGYEAVTVEVVGPLGDPVNATYAIDGTADGGTAVIELAAASGLSLVPHDAIGRPRLSPLTATSYGTGELIRAALETGCTDIVLGIGGSANTDGGAGLLTALGARLLDERDQPISPGGGGLTRLARVDLTGLDPRIASTRFVLAADVTNPLLGPDGAAAVFGPQKGAGPADVELLDRALSGYAGLLAQQLGGKKSELVEAPGSGAAGGVGFAALAVLGAGLRPGIDLVCELVGLDDRIVGADAVITGEGSLDDQSLAGKSPVGVARRAREAGVSRVYAVCGRNLLTGAQAALAGFDQVYALLDEEPDVDTCIRRAAELLRPIGQRIGQELVSWH